MATLKQMALAKAVGENRGRKPLNQLMVESGYTPNTARAHAKEIVKGIAFVDLLEKGGCSNKNIEKVLSAGLKAKTGRKPDHYCRKGYAELVMRAKGLLKDSTPNDPLSGISSFLESIKGLNLDVLIAIKQRINVEPENVAPSR